MSHSFKHCAVITLTLASLAACQTTNTAKESPKDILFAGVSEKVNPVSKRSAEDPTCLTFYGNATQYIAQPDGKKMATGFAKTLALGALSGIAAGGVGAIGISSSFVELALASTANQVVYKGGEKALDKMTGAEGALTPVEEIEDAASELGCPPPSKAAMKGAKKATKAMKKKGDGE